MRLLITGGGTGGHVYPALSVLAAPSARQTLSATLWVGTTGGMERALVERAGIPFAGVPAGGLRGLNPMVQLRHSLRLMRGFGQAWALVRDFRPDAVLATGGYVNGPVGLAAWMQRVPILIYLPDLQPGLAIKALAPLANRVAVTAEPSVAAFASGKAVVTGYPLRPELLAMRDKATARATFGIGRDARLLLVFGGSLGAHALNEAVGTQLGTLLEACELIHIHGKSDGEWLQAQRANLPEAQQRRYHLFDYLHGEMADALRAADLVVSRAGAATLGEYPMAELPAILVPLPLGGVNQAANAAHLQSRGAAVTLPNDQLGERLVPTALSLLRDEARLAEMRRAMRALATPDAAERIFALLRELAQPGTHRTHEITSAG